MLILKFAYFQARYALFIVPVDNYKGTKEKHAKTAKIICGCKGLAPLCRALKHVCTQTIKRLPLLCGLRHHLNYIINAHVFNVPKSQNLIKLHTVPLKKFCLLT